MHPSQPISTDRSVKDLENLQREFPQDYYALALQSIHSHFNYNMSPSTKGRLQKAQWLTKKGTIPFAIRTLVVDQVNRSQEATPTELLSAMRNLTLEQEDRPQEVNLTGLLFLKKTEWVWVDYFKEVNTTASFLLQVLEKHLSSLDAAFVHSLFFGTSPYCYIAPNGGMALEFKGGLPQSFWTPFGQYKFNGMEAENQEVWDEITSRIELEPLLDDQQGTQVFSIRRGLNGGELPRAILKPHGFLPAPEWHDFVSDCHAKWLLLRKRLLPAVVLQPITEEMTPSEKARRCVHNLQLYFQENRSETAESAQINFRSPHFSRVGVISPGGTVSFEDRITFSNDLEFPDLQPIADYILQDRSGNWYKNLRQFEQEWQRELMLSFYPRPIEELVKEVY